MTAGLQDSDHMLMEMLTDRKMVFNLVLTKVDKFKSSKLKIRAEEIID